MSSADSALFEVVIERAASADEVAEVRAAVADVPLPASVRAALEFKSAETDAIVALVVIGPLTAFLGAFAAAAGKDAYQSLKRFAGRAGRRRGRVSRMWLRDDSGPDINLHPDDPDEAYRKLFELDLTRVPTGAMLHWDALRGAWVDLFGTTVPLNPSPNRLTDERPWLVRASYTFMERGATIDEIDQLLGGAPIPPHGGSSHSVNWGPERTTLEWRFASVEDARSAVAKLKDINVIEDPRLARGRQPRVLQETEYSISASAARAGLAICVACGASIQPSHTNLFALEGARPGSQVTLSCDACGLPMEWVILPE